MIVKSLVQKSPAKVDFLNKLRRIRIGSINNEE